MTQPVAAVDFETFYSDEYSVADVGPDAYCDDPRFDPYLVSIVTSDGFSYVGRPLPQLFAEIRNHTWISHNARFDETVFRKLYNGSGAPQNWFCTADLSVYSRGPRSLAKAASALLDLDVSKDVRRQMKGHNYESLERKGLLPAVKEYALRDSEVCLKLWQEYGAGWPDYERQVSRWNIDWGRKGIRMNTAGLQEGIRSVSELRWEAEQNIPWDWDVGKTPLAHAKVREECRKIGIPAPASLAMDSEACAEWEAEFGDRYPFVSAMRQWRRSNMLLKRMQAMSDRIRPDGTMPYSLKYFGGHTGRFSGDSGVNIQNLPREELLGVNLRQLLIPREGHKFVIVDLAQIEARVLLYLAGDTDLLDVIRGGMNLYEAYARKRLGYSGPSPLKKHDPRLYQFAKAAVLGLGYGCGAAKFKFVAKILAGLDLTDAEAVKAVKDYRRANPKIVSLWNKLNAAFRWSRGGEYRIELPSGRDLVYYNVQPMGTSFAAQRERNGILYYYHGGKLAENLVQATSRDILVAGFAPLVKAGLPPLFHVHDEDVMEAREEDASEVLHEAIEIIKTPPAWLEGCPLDAEGMVADYYRK